MFTAERFDILVSRKRQYAAHSTKQNFREICREKGFQLEQEDKIRELRWVIQEAFKDVPYPGDDKTASDKRDEFREHLDEFKGKHWKDLRFEFLVPRHWSSMNFVTPEAYRFYLPAYLLVSAEFYYESDVLADNTLEDLILPLEGESEPWIRERFFQRFDPLTVKQKRAIRLFLEFIRDMYPHEAGFDDDILALERYWKDK